MYTGCLRVGPCLLSLSQMCLCSPETDTFGNTDSGVSKVQTRTLSRQPQYHHIPDNRQEVLAAYVYYETLIQKLLVRSTEIPCANKPAPVVSLANHCVIWLLTLLVLECKINEHRPSSLPFRESRDLVPNWTVVSISAREMTHCF